MKSIDAYHRCVEWSELDQVYLGKSPDLITGIHGDVPLQVYKELNEVVQEVIAELHRPAKELPSHELTPGENYRR